MYAWVDMDLPHCKGNEDGSVKKAEGDNIVVTNIYRINGGGIQRGLAR